MKKRVVNHLNHALDAIIENDQSVILIGEDLLDPYGGAFKVTKGLSTKYKDRIISTPISEASIIGHAIGMAMAGMRPIVEIMFGDFLTLCSDQIINHAIKYNWMYNDKVKIPLVIRTAMGGGRGYGPTHSQSLENFYIGAPGLQIVVPNIVCDIEKLLYESVYLDSPTLFIENKLLYPKYPFQEDSKNLENFQLRYFGEKFPTFLLSINNFEQADVTIVTYGSMLETIIDIANTLYVDDEILVEIIAPTQIKPFNIKPILDRFEMSKLLVTVEEGYVSGGWGQNLIGVLSNHSISFNKPPQSIGALGYPLANTKVLEEKILPSKDRILQTILELI
jgi:pyruvate/2-oxoglutarate/acetoin dehydrogenase E1 component